MPRSPRLDAPGVLHHVMARGIERQRLFRDDHDRDDFVKRLAAQAQAEAWRVYAWALLPNHFHLLVRTAKQPLARTMRSLLTGYAGAFNRRYRRSGHLFQNRYKSIVCEEEPYLLELVRYLHLNPLRARVVNDLEELAHYPYSGHATLVGTRRYPWQETDTVLARFAANLRQARRSYLTFVAEGMGQGRRPELQGGGLVRSAGGWAAVRELQRGREGYLADERVLGGSEFVASLLKEMEREEVRRTQARRGEMTLVSVLEQVCQAKGVRAEELTGGGRRAAVSRVREGIAYLWVEWLGRSGQQVAQALGVRPESVYKAGRRGRREAKRWQHLLGRL